MNKKVVLLPIAAVLAAAIISLLYWRESTYIDAALAFISLRTAQASSFEAKHVIVWACGACVLLFGLIWVVASQKRRKRSAVDSSDLERAFSSSEVLFLEVIEIARRRGWGNFAVDLIRARAAQQILLLDHWMTSRTVEALIDQEDREPSGELDNDANDPQSLNRRLIAARVSAIDIENELRLLADDASFEEIDLAASRLLESHAAAMRTLPDSLREAMDWDQADYHRRFIISGRDVPNRHAPQKVGEQYGPTEDKLHRHAITGIALSGGGVRSASFGLGALQALAKPGLIRVFDFVSGVSGGSWAAGWLAAWAHRHDDGIIGVEDELFRRRKLDTAPLRWVRRHIAYLAPRPGLTSGDTWALLVAYTSNWIPILLLVALAMLGATLTPHFLSASAEWLKKVSSYEWQRGVAYLVTVGVCLFLVLVRRLTLWYREPGPRVRPSPGLFLVVFVASLVGTVPISLYLPVVIPIQGLEGGEHLVDELASLFKIVGSYWIGLNTLAVVVAALLTTTPGQYVVDILRLLVGAPNIRSGTIRRHSAPLSREFFALSASVLFFSAALAILIYVAVATNASAGLRMTYGPILAISAFAVAELFGLMFTRRRDVDRAWIARVGAWIIAAILSWTVVCTFALGVTSLWRDPDRKELSYIVAATLCGLLLCGAWFSSRKSAESRNVFAVWVALTMLTPAVPIAASYMVRNGAGHIVPMQHILIQLVVVGAIFFALAAACNVNRFSLHAIYRQGLVRTFLGASRLALRNPLRKNGSANGPDSGDEEALRRIGPLNEPFAQDASRVDLRRPAPATNIDDADDPNLAWLASSEGRQLPVLLFNAAVNGISKTDLEGRVPRQWPFTFSQYFSGSPATGIGYARTSSFSSEGRAPGERTGVTLGSAMAVSGAAMSPTSGNLTHPVRAFLLGALNARLGLWIGNPSKPEAVQGVKPKLAGLTILREMLGLRAKFGDWIHLSDGGHFENLGIYELLRRGCLRIVAIDASCDPKRKFDDLADAIRRARIDLDVDIYPRNNWGIREPFSDERDGGAKSWMWFEIDYGSGLPRGRLLYIKPSVYHHEIRQGADVHNYWREEENFPHESTMNQFFTERQMEAYRTLGETCMAAALDEVLNSPAESSMAIQQDGSNLGPVQVPPGAGRSDPQGSSDADGRTDNYDAELKRLILWRW